MTKRKSWDKHWMEVAEHASEMSTCAAGRKVGAVFVKENRLLTTGFNGVPAKTPHPLICVRRKQNVPSGEKLDMCGCAHAEANSIANAARDGVSLKGSKLYCTTEPCVMCSGALANVGISAIIYRDAYPNNMGADILRNANIVRLKYSELYPNV